MNNLENILTKEFLLKEHFTNKKTYQEISDMVGCDRRSVVRYVKFHGIKEKRIQVTFVGCRFGKLTVMERLENAKYGQRVWLCKCDCGKFIKRPTGELRNRSKYGRDTSCGCGAFDNRKQTINWKGCGDIHGSMWGRIERGAKSRNYPFEITIEYGWDLFLKQNKKCALSGIDIYFPKTDWEQKRGEWTASLDRIDSMEGYIEGNVQWVYKDINRIKWAYNQEYFIKMCVKVASKGRKNEKK